MPPPPVQTRRSNDRSGAEIEAAIARINLVTNWRPRSATTSPDLVRSLDRPLHVGVTSPASRRHAEAVAAHAGLSGNVIATPVPSTLAELEAAQERWGHFLSDLFARAEVGTGFRRSDNAVAVELGSSVPVFHARLSWNRRLTADPVNV